MYRASRFLGWLTNQDGDTIVGVTNDNCKCPVARWLVEHIGYREASVLLPGNAMAMVYDSLEWVTLELDTTLWRFVSLVDKTYTDHNADYNGPSGLEVTSRQCIQVLVKAMQDEAGWAK